jgi:2,4-dienoyl-CoA reductase-like NADH-dependent reductase (Old Yellow Enzyme family)
MIASLSTPIQLPCGATLPNRLAKAAMTEGLADSANHATEALDRLYRLWAGGGAGLHITGNVQVDRRYMERPANVAIEDESGLEALRRWARAGTSGGCHLWMQISHAGRQTPRYVSSQPVAPSATGLPIPGAAFARPRALTEPEIEDVVRRFGEAARVARSAGFTGVQVHSAHGYLLSEFLSPHVNRRTDSWGGALEARARLLLSVVRAVRAAVGADFPVAVKLNSSDFQKGGFTLEECCRVVQWLGEEGIDLLEISGGTYEQPSMFGVVGDAQTLDPPPRESTRRREAYFLEYAAAVRQAASMPLMVTGGFRTREAMSEALEEGNVDVIGLARPLCGMPDAPARLLKGAIDRLPSYEQEIRLGRGRLGPNSPLILAKALNVWAIQAWFCCQIFRMAEDLAPDLNLGAWRALLRYQGRELSAARKLKR